MTPDLIFIPNNHSTNSLLLMPKTIDLIGQKFGRLTVLKKSHKKSSANAIWHCLCDCGRETHVPSLKMRKGLIVSCGCKRIEVPSNLRHGMANKSRTYRSWKEMRQRCLNPNSTQYQWYGGRGIGICERWGLFENFLSDMGERPENMTIDRINSDAGYSPENCRWATAKQQAETNRGVIKKGSEPTNKTSKEIFNQVKGHFLQGKTAREISSIVQLSLTTIYKFRNSES